MRVLAVAFTFVGSGGIATVVTLSARYRDPIVVACLFGSGFLTLVYEVCWVRQASLAFGSATLALSTVLAVFFGGLALGSFLMSRFVGRVVRPLAWYAGLEIAIGICALISVWEFAWADQFFELAYPHVQESFAGLSLLRFAVLLTILLPPATLMGGTLPLLCRYIVRCDRRLTWSIGYLYGVNTFGAAVGCAICGFWLLPVYGIQLTVMASAAANVCLGGVVALLSTTGSRLGSEPATTLAPSPKPTRLIGLIGFWFFVTGFVALGNEVLWARFLSLLVYDTVYTYTLTITVVLAGIVVGSLLSGFLFDRAGNHGFWLGAVQVGTGLIVLAVLFLPPSLWRAISQTQGTVGQLLVTAVVLFVPATLAGMGFPLFIRVACSGHAEVAARVGQLTAFNTVGGILGSLCIGFAALPQLGMQTCLLITTGLSVASGIAVWFLFRRDMKPAFVATCSVAAVAMWLVLPTISGAKLPQDYLGSKGEIIDFSEGLNCNLAVVRNGDFLQLEADRLWQGEDRKTHQIMAAHVPMLFHENPQRVAVVGVGPGQTASRFLMHPIKQLDCIDIESELFPLIRRYFHGEWLDDPRVRVVVEDGRNYITHTDREYDIVSIEVGQTFRPCVSGFYTVDFYERARKRLAKNGLLVQFASLEFLGEKEFRTVVRSFVEVFPQSVLWYNRAELLLIGTAGDKICLSQRQLTSILHDEELRADLDFSYWGGEGCRLDRLEPLLAGLLAGPKELERLGSGARLYRSDRPFLEYATSRLQPDSMRAVVELLRARLGDIEQLTTTTLSPQSLAEIRTLQRQNLDDLLATELNWQALDLIARHELDSTIVCARRAAKLNPRNFWSNLLLADALAAMGRQGEAISHYETAADLRPDDLAVRSRLKLAQHGAVAADQPRE